jgi:parvulin-like peptidyl-prolyl isomerase
MSWRGRLARTWLASALAACGCLTKASTLTALPPLSTSTAAAEAGNRNEGPEVARSQKPETSHSSSNSVCLLSLPVDRPSEASHANPAATIRAVVNGELILDEELRMVSVAQIAGARTAKERQQIYKDALDKLIERELCLQDAFGKLQRGGKQGEAFIKKIHEAASEDFEKRWLQPVLKQKHLSSREELEEQMRQGGLSLDVMRRWWERNYMAQQYVLTRIDQHVNRIGHAEISEYYANHRDEFTQPDSVQWQDVFLDVKRHASRAAARQFAESLVQRIRQGEDFAQLSYEFDDGASGRFRKGEGEGHKHGEIFPREAEAVLFAMHDGDVEILDCPRGLHVIRLVKRQYAGPLPFDAKVQKEIRDKLRMEVYNRERESLINDLKFKAVIDRNDRVD